MPVRQTSSARSQALPASPVHKGAEHVLALLYFSVTAVMPTRLLLTIITSSITLDSATLLVQTDSIKTRQVSHVFSAVLLAKPAR